MHSAELALLSNSSAVVDAGTMPWTLEAILSQHVASPLALVRQSACVWLLSILRHAGKHPQVQVGMDHLPL